MDPLTAINLRRTSQDEQADPRQVPNSAGGFTFTVDDEQRLRRFLVLGTTGGTFYVSERDLTADNAQVVLGWARERSSDLVARVVEVSVAGRAPRQQPAIFALAAAAALGDEAGKRAALDAVPQVCRTGTALFQFVAYSQQFRGWGRGLRTAVSRWYLTQPIDRLAYQTVKYRQRDGWSHRDLLRKAHPATSEATRRELFDWVCGRDGADLAGLPLIQAFLDAQAATTVDAWVRLVETNPSLSWEMLPDAALNEPEVWRALVAQGMPMTALVRQLPRLTRLGVVGGMSDVTATVAEQLVDRDRLRRARVHPLTLLVALRTYASGHGVRGSGEWSPVAKILDALDAAFYAAFDAVEPAGKRTLLALDVSGSMGVGLAGLPLSAREGSGALALVTAATEPSTHIVGFTAGRGRSAWSNYGTALTDLPISPRQRLDDVLKTITGIPFGGTDCSLPMVMAKEKGWQVETFVVLTDNETWAGDIHPHQALREYREASGIDARMIVVGMTSTGFTIADPTDPGSLDVVGFDTATPSLIADFSAGRI